MTQETIDKLEELLNRREVVQNEIEAFDRIFSENADEIFYNINMSGWDGNNCLHIIKDMDGLMMNSLREIYKRYKQELRVINEEIEKL